MVEKKTKLRLGELLIHHGVLDQNALERALIKQKEKGGLLGEVLLQMGLVKEEDIVIALSRQFNIPYIPVQNCEINQKLLKLVPIDLVRKHHFLPIDKINEVLTVIMVDPTNDYAKKDIEEATGLRVQALVGTATEIINAIKRHYKITDGILELDMKSKEIAQKSFQKKSKEQTGDDS